MSLPLVIPNEPITADAHNAIVTQVNTDASKLARIIPLMTTADQSKTGNTFTDINGLSFPVVNGRFYYMNFMLWFTTGNNATGVAVGYNGPTGNVRAYVDIGAATLTSEWINGGVDSGTGTTTSTSGSRFGIKWLGLYQCTANGTFALRYKRNATSSTVTILAGSGGLVMESV